MTVARPLEIAATVAIAALAGSVAAWAQPLALAPAAFEQSRRVVQFTEAKGNVDNPERGFSWAIDLFKDDGYARVRDRHGVTLVRVLGRLDAWRTSDIPAEQLATIDQRMASARAAGVKVMLRFAYNEGPSPNPEPDASLDWIKRHIAQLMPVLRKHADVIAWMEAGFIGAWGEWHDSTNGLDRDPAAKRDVVRALLDALPPSRAIQLRTPSDMMLLHGPRFPEGNAHNGSDQARTGHHNDCFLASDDDSGTYGRGRRSVADDKALIAVYGRYTPIGGETCLVNPPRSECQAALTELAQLGYSELNLAHHKEVLDSWRTGGCFEEIRARLGHRLVIDEVALPEKVVRGADALITLKIRNTGFAAPVNARPVWLVLDGPVRRYFSLPYDPRKWLPGKTHVIEAVAVLPATLPAGRYSLSLWMPDEVEALQRNPRYAIRLANEGLWNQSSGLNRLVGDLVIQ